MHSSATSSWHGQTDAVATTATLFADFKLETAGAGEDSSTDSVQTPVGWGGGLLELQTPRKERSSDLAWRHQRLAPASHQGTAQQHRTRAKSSPRPGYRRLWHQVTSMGSSPGNSGTHPELTVEDLVAMIQKLPGDVPVIPAVAEGLWTLDSRAAAALLKELSKVGLTQRAFELFDWLRDLPSSHELHGLCDVFTYTTVIALCGQRQALRRSLGLMAEMRSRNVSANVHTYSALMNVCIKCGELDLALDVFNQLQVEGCRANVVTFNTLIDVYGKLGRWQDAIGVLGMISMQGLQPETRTFNTIIIACNMCGQPQEALQVFARMTALGYTPTSTTYTALISAYGKAGQLDAALNTFEQMVARGCERNVITYSALISACEKAGRWQLALSLLEEMHRDKVSPNTVTFNSLISACAQGAQGGRADALFQAMKSQRCKPDIVTFAALVSAHERCADWRGALQAFEDMQAAGCRPDGAVYSIVINALWCSGVQGPRAKAIELYAAAISYGLFSMAAHVSIIEGVLEVVLSPLTPSVAVLALHRWLSEARQQVQREGAGALGLTTAIMLGKAGKAPREVLPASSIQDTMTAALTGWGAPFQAEAKGSATRLVASSAALVQWLQSPAFAASALAIGVPADGAPSPTSAQLVVWEAAAEAASTTALASLDAIEARQAAASSAASASYAEARPGCAQALAALAVGFGGGDHVVHDALAILDRCVAASLSFCSDTASLLVTTCFWLSRQHIAAAGSRVGPEILEEHRSLPADSLRQAAELVQAALVGDLAVTTPLRHLDAFSGILAGAAGRHHPPPSSGAAALATGALAHRHALHLRPALVAAAALVLDRVRHGVLPAWPLALAVAAGLPGPGAADFDAALAVVGLAGAHQGPARQPSQPVSPQSPPLAFAQSNS